MASSSRRFQLRDQTAAAHEALEALIGPLTTQSAYRRYLRGLHAGRRPVEEAIARQDWPASAGDWRPLPLAPLLAADLADLGEAPPRPVAAPPPSITDHSRLLGALYVLEGSALGARLVIRHAAALGFGAANGARHLAAQTGTTGAWPRFLQVLEAAEGFDPVLAVASANEMFAFLGRAMREGSGIE